MGEASWLTAAEAARLLQVKRATLYAYVSRGVLSRRRSPDGRGSLFDPAEVADLARRSRPRRPPSPAELVIESAVTTFVDELPFYRGLPVVELAATRSFEDVATLLWTGRLPDLGDERLTWRASPDAIAAGVTAQSGLPTGTLPLERLQVIVPSLAATDHLRLQLDVPAVVAAAQTLIAGMVDCLPDVRRTESRTGVTTDDAARAVTRRSVSAGAASSAGDASSAAEASVADRLWPKLCPSPPAVELGDAVRAALVLLADHELAASTLAVRVAASVRADPYAAVSAGLGAVGGAMHGGASLAAETLLAELADPREAPRVIGERLRRGERIPGFGHFVYKHGDPRGTLLLGLLRDLADRSGRTRLRADRLVAAEAVLAEAHRRRLPEPNIDFALATLVAASGMIKGAGEAIFAIARAAGWIAHALEEYAHGTPLRPRAVYTGPAPSHH